MQTLLRKQENYQLKMASFPLLIATFFFKNK